MSALEAAWSVLKGEYIHPSVALHSQFGERSDEESSMYGKGGSRVPPFLPSKPQEARSDFTDRQRQYDQLYDERSALASEHLPETEAPAHVLRMPGDPEDAKYVKELVETYNETNKSIGNRSLIEASGNKDHRRDVEARDKAYDELKRLGVHRLVGRRNYPYMDRF
tara:strand:+ start:299 stop:796 length:498 start_codon:yes stop_codon:yes gene_type:complete